MESMSGEADVRTDASTETEIVYSPEMAAKSGVDLPRLEVRLAGVEERLTLSTRVALGFMTVCVGFAAYTFVTLESHGERLARLESAVERIDKRVDQIDTKIDRLLDRQAREALIAPEASNAEEVKQAAIRARERNLEVTPTEIKDVSATLLGAHPDGEQWNAAIALMDLRSHVNAGIPEAGIFRFAKIFTPLSDRAEWAKQPKGEFIGIEGMTIILDPESDERRKGTAFLDAPGIFKRVFRNVVFRKCVIQYNGGPITLENVLFENCTFKVNPSERGVQLARDVLNTAPVSIALGP